MQRRAGLPFILILHVLVVASTGSSAGGQATLTPIAHGYRSADQASGYTGDFAALVTAVDTFWAQTFRAAGIAYAPPAVVSVDRPLSTACDPTGPADYPFYCALDSTIYLHARFLQDAVSNIGDFAPIMVLAHEWGHHVQALTNTPYPGSKPNEQQADCLAGVYAKDAEQQGLLDPGDVTEGVLMSASVGDPLWWPEDSPGAHGTNDERISAFMRGYLNGLPDCELRGFDASAPLPPDDITAYLPSLLPLDHSQCFRIEDDTELSFDDLLGRLGGTDEARRRLRQWGWQASANRTFACDTPPQGDAGWIAIDVHRFADAPSAQEAVDFFAAVRAEGTALRSGAPPGAGDHAVALSGPASNGQEHTIYASKGPLLVRVTGVSQNGLPFFNVRQVARTILAVPLPAPSLTPQPTAMATATVTATVAGVAAYLPTVLPLGHAACFRADDPVEYDFSALVDRFPGVPNAAGTLQSLGWQEGAYRQFSCAEPPANGVGWIDVSIHRFQDAASAVAAGPFYASSRATDTQLATATAPAIGDSATALAGPSDVGTEYTLYVSSGRLLLRVTGVAPDGDPQLDVERVMQALYANVLLRGQQDQPTSAPPSPTVIPSPMPVPSPTPPEQAPTMDATTYSIVDLGTGNGNWSSANLINESGQVVMTTGTARDPMDRIVTDAQVKVWQDGEVIDVIPQDAGIPVALNETGTVLLGYSRNGNNLLFQSASGLLRSLPGFETDSYPADINNAGLVVGQVGADGVIADATSTQIIPLPPGFGFVGPAAINTAGDVVGTARFSRSNDSVQRAFVFADAVMTVLGPAPGAESSRAVDLNDHGLVLGGPGIFGMHSIPGTGHAFVYDRGKSTTTDIGTLPGYSTSAPSAINNAGQVVGFAFASDDSALPVRSPFLYDYRTGELTELNQIIPADSGWQLMDAFDINDAGRIVGRGLIGGEMHAFVLIPVR